jgi:hypothetical protein
LEKGNRCIFVPHSAGVYVSITLNPCENNVANLQYDTEYNVNKYYQCNSLLNIDSVDEELRDLLMYILFI